MFDRLFGCGAQIQEGWRYASSQPGYLHMQAAKRQEHVVKALDLVKGRHPGLNLQPYIDLVAQADAMGFDIVKRAAHNTEEGR